MCRAGACVSEHEERRGLCPSIVRAAHARARVARSRPRRGGGGVQMEARARLIQWVMEEDAHPVVYNQHYRAMDKPLGVTSAAGASFFTVGLAATDAGAVAFALPLLLDADDAAGADVDGVVGTG